MTSKTVKPVLVIAGLGDGSGTGGSTARIFAKEGYTVALVSRGSTTPGTASTPSKLADQIIASGGNAAAFPIASYTPDNIAEAWKTIHAQFPFETSVEGAFEFAREAITAFKANSLEEPIGKRGTLIITGARATASIRGNVFTSLFSSTKFAMRALSQSLATEFGKENIHVAHAIIDGRILMNRQRERQSEEWANNEDGRLLPDSIAKSYLYLVNQDRSSWTWEIDLRPAHQEWSDYTK
ncbi:hypothetical protein BJ165DRAFT_1568615 [Panaeolus papilionaceus]|nr:hypothetical protein BJ165DRAFT_1568615 [Panaeolus papilionaceus]